MQLLSSSRLPHQFARASAGALRPPPPAPSFARAGGYEVIPDPFLERLRVVHAEPGDVELSTRLTLTPPGAPLLVHWEVARDARFQDLERYGLFFAHAHLDYRVRIALTGLSLGRAYWARLWAGGSWSSSVRVHTESGVRSRARASAQTPTHVALTRVVNAPLQRLGQPALCGVVCLPGATPRSVRVPQVSTEQADL